MSLSVRTYKDIQDAIIEFAKIEDSDANRTKIKRMINTEYQDLADESNYRWSGTDYKILLPKKYTTGTIAVTNNSDTITGTGTGWTEFSHLHKKIRVGSGKVAYKIIRVDEAGQVITLDQIFLGGTESGVGYTIFQDEFPLQPDIKDVRTFTIPGRSTQPHKKGPSVLDYYMAQDPFRGGLPIIYTMHDKGIYTSKTWATFNLGVDYWEDDFDDEPKNENMVVWPAVRDEDRIAKIRGTLFIPLLSADTDEPLIPYPNRSVLVWGVLKKHFLKNRDVAMKREWEREYEGVKTMMRVDIEGVDDKFILRYNDRRRTHRNSYSIYTFDNFDDD